MIDYIYVLTMDYQPGVRVFIDPEIGMREYIAHINERVESFDSESLEMNTDNGGYDAYWDGEFIASLERVMVEHG